MTNTTTPLTRAPHSVTLLTADNLTDAQIREYRASVLGSAALDAELALGLHITESSDEAYYSSRMDQREARYRVADAINARGW